MKNYRKIVFTEHDKECVNEMFIIATLIKTIVCPIDIAMVTELHVNISCIGTLIPSAYYTTAKKKRPNQLGYLVGIWL